MTATIPFIDLKSQHALIGPAVNLAIAQVLEHGHYINGPEIEVLESKLAEFCNIEHVVSCSSGTDALFLALMALEIGPGDAVLVPAFTFAATAETVVLTGATPLFLDVDADTFNVVADAVEAGARAAAELGLKPRAIIPVDLFGQPANYPAISEVARHLGLAIIADAAQSFGGSWHGRRVGSLADITVTSFFPAKPLGCYGDGGAVLTKSLVVDGVLRSLREHGKGTSKYQNVRRGINGRLDTIQAAILLAKLPIFEDELLSRQRVADRYTANVPEIIRPQHIDKKVASAWAQYTVVLGDREQVREKLQAAGVPTRIYYPIPLHMLDAYRSFPRSTPVLPVSEHLAQNVLSLPMHPYLEEATQDRIIDLLR